MGRSSRQRKARRIFGLTAEPMQPSMMKFKDVVAMLDKVPQAEIDSIAVRHEIPIPVSWLPSTGHYSIETIGDVATNLFPDVPNIKKNMQKQVLSDQLNQSTCWKRTLASLLYPSLEDYSQLGLMSLLCLEVHPDRSPYFPFSKKVQEIGHMLNSQGGFRLMVTAVEAFVPKYDHREIEYIWDGIGEWRC